ncbi:DUF4167 domain-containing protein [Alsobacter soli]|uniref:DUF4167 domain-containing protein n=1 Tax=Alsobacter soli TaxID=2109933 RepID=A0A2T1HW18_9HYPH|nr:DUF4167 domain-containing protein [Alsobacter soli]PSC05853.1 DUF4167 domain-containing protein [Alsobacter soli]
MRPNHQNNNKRMRGRNRGGGKGPNPLSRSYESNGPDVKIRGTAQHIAEKYLQLGRDASASGDPVLAESYFQHAEHYLRLIAAAQEQFRQQNPHYRPFEIATDGDDEGDEDTTPYAGGPQPDVRFPQAALDGEGQDYGQQQPRQFQPRERGEGRDGRDFQPRRDREGRDFQPRERREFQPREAGDQGDFQPRERRERDFQPRREREPREHREFQPREAQPEAAGGEQPRETREFQPREGRFPRRGRDRQERQDRQDRAAPEGAEPAALPAFITAPVRAVAPAEPEPAPVEAAAPTAPAEDSLAVRPRRRRTTKKAEAAPADAPAGE